MRLKKAYDSDIIRMNIKRLIEEQNLTQAEVAKRMNITRQAFQKYLKDDYEFSEEILKNVTKALDVPVRELFSSERRNARRKYVKARQEYYATKGGKQVILFIILLIVFFCILFKRRSVFVIGLVAFMFLLDFTGMIVRIRAYDPNMVIERNWQMILYRVVEILLVVYFVVLLAI